MTEEFDDGAEVGSERQPGIVPVPMGLFARRRKLGGPVGRRRPVDELLNSAEGVTDSLTCFKVSLPLAKSAENRPVSAHCLYCYPGVQRSSNTTLTLMGIRNCFSVDRKSWFPLLWRCWNKREEALKYELVREKELVDNFLRPEDFDRAIRATNPDGTLSVEDAKNRMTKFIYELGIGNVTNEILRLIIGFGGWVLSSVLRCFFDAVCVHEGQIELLKTYSRNHPVVYVPVQRSSWDHFILSWVLVSCSVKAPLALTSNLFTEASILGKLRKLVGGLGRLQGSKTKLESSEVPFAGLAVELYIKSLLKNRMSMELAVESHRSRNGNPSTVVIGTELFVLISKLVEEGSIEDAIIVPVSVNYEKFPEDDIIGNYDRKTRPGFFRLVWAFIFQKFGHARVNFGHPISVREFQSTAINPAKRVELLDRTDQNASFWMTGGYCLPVASKDLNWDNDDESVTSVQSSYGYLGVISKCTKHVTLISDCLAAHALYDAWKSTVFMSTNLVAFVLLTKRQNREAGVCFDKLVGDVCSLMSSIREQRGDFGFTPGVSVGSVIHRSVKLLGNDLVRAEACGNGTVIKPVWNRESLLALGYYAAPVVSLFAMEGIIATVLFALRGRKLALLNGTRAQINVQEKDLIEKAAQLCELLKGEFLLYPPCLQLEDAVRLTIDKMRDKYLLCYESIRVHRDDDEDLEFGDNARAERIEIKSVEEPEVYDKLSRARSLIIPYLKAYAVMFHVLYELLPSEGGGVQEDILVEDLRKKMLQKLMESSHVSTEIVSVVTVKNFICALKNLAILGEDVNGSGRVVMFLCDEYSTSSDLNAAMNKILYFYSC